ncbi:hypothetical protein DLM78_01170 [Leptospira stimsonii]|uniref:Uncharacterized protein n=1 Tax=Leptospira stimsonii TaxID=2202203 RepID=A0A8B3CUD1_9LEPT|nr:hypothetical protein DLM78_01170 [Leptospira stimsonii]
MSPDSDSKVTLDFPSVVLTFLDSIPFLRMRVSAERFLKNPKRKKKAKSKETDSHRFVRMKQE